MASATSVDARAGALLAFQKDSVAASAATKREGMPLIMRAISFVAMAVREGVASSLLAWKGRVRSANGPI